MKNPLLLTSLLITIFLGTMSAEAANHYIRAGATGSAPCSDWNPTNACATLPSTLIRGDTYYIADGTYPAYTFDDPLSGSLAINVKKATVADHGTDAGWNDTFGDGQASFGVFTIRTGYLVIDGVTRNEADWFDGTAYGFKIGTSADQVQIRIEHTGITPTNVIIQYAFLDGYPRTTATVGAYALYADLDGRGQSTNMVYRRLFIKNSSNGIVPWDSTGTLIEYVALDGNWSNDNNHGDPINVYFSVLDLTVRYSKFRNVEGTAVIPIASWNSNRHNPRVFIYGNVFWDFNTGDGAIGYTGSSQSAGDCTNSFIYNNTFVRGKGYNNGISCPQGSGNTIRNNLWINNTASVSINVGSGSTITDNGFSGPTGQGSNAQVNIPSSIFTNYNAGDFTLATNTTSGVTLDPPYDKDLLGNSRRTGAWSKGAYQFSADGVDLNPPMAPVNLRVQ